MLIFLSISSCRTAECPAVPNFRPPAGFLRMRFVVSLTMFESGTRTRGEVAVNGEVRANDLPARNHKDNPFRKDKKWHYSEKGIGPDWCETKGRPRTEVRVSLETISSPARLQVAGFSCPASPPVPNTTRPPGLHVGDKSRASRCTGRARSWYGKQSCRNREYIFASPRCCRVYREHQASCVRQ